MTDKAQNVILIRIIKDTLWMARRYANGRKTYAPGIINDALSTLGHMGITINSDATLIHDGNSSSQTLDI